MFFKVSLMSFNIYIFFFDCTCLRLRMDVSVLME